MSNLLVAAAVALGVVAVVMTVLILARLQWDAWPHGRNRLCPDPHCACNRTHARRATKGPRRAR